MMINILSLINTALASSVETLDTNEIFELTKKDILELATFIASSKAVAEVTKSLLYEAFGFGILAGICLGTFIGAYKDRPVIKSMITSAIAEFKAMYPKIATYLPLIYAIIVIWSIIEFVGYSFAGYNIGLEFGTNTRFRFANACYEYAQSPIVIENLRVITEKLKTDAVFNNSDEIYKFTQEQFFYFVYKAGYEGFDHGILSLWLQCLGVGVLMGLGLGILYYNIQKYAIKKFIASL